MKGGPKLFYMFLIPGVASCVILWIIPGNKYEWMRTDPAVGTPGSQLPIDPDSGATFAIIAIPAVVIAVVNLANAILRLQGAVRVLAVAFSLLLLVMVYVKFQSS
jgi:hypothetical protein